MVSTYQNSIVLCIMCFCHLTSSIAFLVYFHHMSAPLAPYKVYAGPHLAPYSFFAFFIPCLVLAGIFPYAMGMVTGQPLLYYTLRGIPFCIFSIAAAIVLDKNVKQYIIKKRRKGADTTIDPRAASKVSSASLLLLQVFTGLILLFF